ncbi:MAG: gamma-glutamyltranspeptidase/glutathione hydrolase [Woeseiaceae bacterium]|jgi:gamma-glutamyltranspeptidase/glutathione hydrolase|tara:strand:- start:4420 stop:6120 length:1701 start_codon:yes stop_codon:yes gene_type:complete
MKNIIITGIFFMTNVFSSEMGFDRVTGLSFASRSEVIASNGMAATSHPLATQVALDILKKGGTAIDAAIAANAVLGLVEPTGCGIGGDLFAIIWDAKKQELNGLNASGRSPGSLTLDYFKEKNITEIPYLGPLPITVPGAVDGWFEMHNRYGKLSMIEILEPAIAYAEEGFPVSEVVSWLWEENTASRVGYEGFRNIYMPNGRAPKKGEIFKNPALASTYKKIGMMGRDEFYKGDIAKKIDAFMVKNDAFLRYEDLANHSSEWVKPVSTNYRGYEVFELPPNTQGIAVLQLLNILEGFDLSNMNFASAEYIHTFVEAKKIVYEDRAKYYADPKYSNISTDILITKEYAKKRRNLINPNIAAKEFLPGDIKLENDDTIYLTVADSEGNMVSLIQSNYGDMGAGLTSEEFGFSFQNRGQLFSLNADHPNVYAPNKRPFHTIIPAFVTKDNKPWLSFGLMGGSMQPQGHAQILINMIDFDMNLQEAGDAARIRHVGSSQPTDEEMNNGGRLYLESSIDETTREKLRKLGHNIATDTNVYGGYQAIMWDEEHKVYYGASDPRKDGQAAGY